MKTILDLMMGVALCAYLCEPVTYSTYNDDWLLLTEDVRDLSGSEGIELRELWSSFRHGRRFQLVLRNSQKDQIGGNQLRSASGPTVGASLDRSNGPTLNPSLSLVNSKDLMPSDEVADDKAQALHLGALPFADNSFRQWNEMVVEFAPVGAEINAQPMFNSEDANLCKLHILGIKKIGGALALALEVEIAQSKFKVYPVDENHLKGRSDDGQLYIEMTVTPPLKIQSFYVGSTQSEQKSIACLVDSPPDLSKTKRSVALH